jgi:restriction system protein
VLTDGIGKGASKGVFVTTSTFSKQAEDFVQHLPQRIILINGKRLIDLMIEHDVGVRVGRVVEFKRVEFKRIDEDFSRKKTNLRADASPVPRNSAVSCLW